MGRALFASYLTPLLAGAVIDPPTLIPLSSLSSLSLCSQHHLRTCRLVQRRARSCEHSRLSYIIIVAHRKSKPLPRSYGVPLHFGVIPADLAYLTEITLRDIPNRDYSLRLFVENEEIELQKTANRSWTPAKRQYALSFLLTGHT